MKAYYYQIFRVIGNNDDGDIYDFDNPYKGMKFNNQCDAQEIIDRDNLDGWKAIDVEEF